MSFSFFDSNKTVVRRNKHKYSVPLIHHSCLHSPLDRGEGEKTERGHGHGQSEYQNNHIHHFGSKLSISKQWRVEKYEMLLSDLRGPSHLIIEHD